MESEPKSIEEHLRSQSVVGLNFSIADSSGIRYYAVSGLSLDGKLDITKYAFFKKPTRANLTFEKIVQKGYLISKGYIDYLKSSQDAELAVQLAHNLRYAKRKNNGGSEEILLDASNKCLGVYWKKGNVFENRKKVNVGKYILGYVGVSDEGVILPSVFEPTPKMDMHPIWGCMVGYDNKPIFIDPRRVIDIKWRT